VCFLLATAHSSKKQQGIAPNDVHPSGGTLVFTSRKFVI
jgi:hypothetical protein